MMDFLKRYRINETKTTTTNRNVTQDFKSVLKYLRSNLVNKQDDLQ